MSSALAAIVRLDPLTRLQWRRKGENGDKTVDGAIPARACIAISIFVCVFVCHLVDCGKATKYVVV